MRTILLRLKDLLLLCFVMSPAACALYYYNVIPNTDAAYAILLFFVAVIFIISNIFMLRRCFFEIGNLKIYYILNYVAYGIFILITAVSYLLFSEVAYAWLFSTLKFFKFADNDLSTAGATAVMHIIMLVVIALAPLGMGWVLHSKEENF